jgi:hypothetical protein
MSNLNPNNAYMKSGRKNNNDISKTGKFPSLNGTDL